MEELICRVCLVETGEFQTIFTSVELVEAKTTMCLSEMITSFADVQITLGEGLPEQICKSCAEDVIQLYFFKTRCEESDKILRKRLIDKQLSVKIDKVKLEESDNGLEDFEQGFANFDSDDNEDDERLLSAEVKIKPKKIKDFECTVCNKRFTREDLLLRHKIAHARKMPDFDTEDSQSENSEAPKKTECVEVDGTFAMDTSNTIILENEDCLKAASSYICHLCGLVSTNGAFLEKHYVEEHLEPKKDQLYACKLCNDEIGDLSGFSEHIKKRHCENRDQKISCPCCFMEFKKKVKLTKCKNKTSKEDKEELCSHCNKVFKSKKGLKKHLTLLKISTKKIDFKKKPYVCEICLKAFNQLSNLKDHLRTHNGEKPFLCPTCGKGFNQLGNLRQHQVRHSGVKSHICTTCNHGFASKGELHAHLRKHTGARPFVCDACGNGFTTSSSLTKHKRIHSGEKPYECDYCKMKFSRSGILSRHRRIHTGEKPYVCKICRKAFTQSNDLNSHLRIHTGEKPYKCDECGQPFRQSSALRTHKKTHSEPKPQHVRQLMAKKDREMFVEDEENILVKFEELPSVV